MDSCAFYTLRSTLKSSYVIGQDYPFCFSNDDFILEPKEWSLTTCFNQFQQLRPRLFFEN